MYESPSVSLMSQDVEAGFWYSGANILIVVNAVGMANALAIANAAGYENVAAATLAVVAGAFIWVAGAITFNSGVMPIVDDANYCC